MIKLKQENPVQKNYDRHHELADRCERLISQMAMELLIYGGPGGSMSWI